MDAREEELLAHLRNMRQRAEAITKDLGLPPEDKYKVMAAAYKINPALVGGLQTVQPYIETSSETRLKELVYDLGKDFVNAQMQELFAPFQELWERVKTLPVTSVSELGLRSASSGGIGVIGGNQESKRLVPILSTISWAVIQYPTLHNTEVEHITTTIAEEAEARGCSRAMSHRLAHYIQTHAPYAA